MCNILGIDEKTYRNLLTFDQNVRTVNSNIRAVYPDYPPWINVLKLQTFAFLFANKTVGYLVWNSQNACQNSKQGSLIWACTVYLGLFGKQLVFRILEHLPCALNSFQMITWMKTVVGTVAFVVPVTISFMDKIGMIVKVEGASMQVYCVSSGIKFSTC